MCMCVITIKEAVFRFFTSFDVTILVLYWTGIR